MTLCTNVHTGLLATGYWCSQFFAFALGQIACRNTHAALVAREAMTLITVENVVIATQQQFVIHADALVLCHAIAIAVGVAQTVVAVAANGALDQIARRLLHNRHARGAVKPPMLARVHLVLARSVRALARLRVAIERNAGQTELAAGRVVDLQLDPCNDGALESASDTEREVAIAAVVGSEDGAIEYLAILVVDPHSSRLEVRQVGRRHRQAMHGAVEFPTPVPVVDAMVLLHVETVVEAPATTSALEVANGDRSLVGREGDVIEDIGYRPVFRIVTTVAVSAGMVCASNRVPECTSWARGVERAALKRCRIADNGVLRRERHRMLLLDASTARSVRAFAVVVRARPA